MNEYTNRGFEMAHYAGICLQQSSEIGDYEDAFDKPGSSAIWVREPSGSINREGVAETRDALTRWLETGSFAETEGAPENAH